MRSDYLARVKTYEDEVEYYPMDKFHYKWKDLQALNYQEYRNIFTNHHVFKQIFYLYAIETGRIEYVYDIDDTIVINMMKKMNLSILLEEEKNKTKNECEQIIKIINIQLKSIFNNSQQLPLLFTLDYLKRLHADHIKYAPFTSQYVPELQAQIRTLIPSGRFKLAPNSPTRKDGKLFQFCPPSQVEQQLKLLFSLYEKYEQKHIDPVILAAWFHAEFIRIHPFVDDNGRVGRFLSSKILMDNDLLPFIVEKRKKLEYIDCKDESIAQNNLTSLVNFIKREQYSLIEYV
ncbi:unnamed protein product [Rotaria sp. Silwood1]|nr:unnamed protein product [Rotaria sp. Silwood1]CAF3441068.1 unnamed protein product [Rotaria sp. Silwood1]CAF4641049.1 unnamed protein product [Rotaria sp. Silwood1]